MRLRPLFVAFALVASGLAACGGDDEPTTTTASGPPPATLSAEAFASQANAICVAADKELDPPQSIQAQVDAIRALPAPEEIQDDVNALLDDTEEVLAELAADPSRVGGDPFAEVDERAAELGLTECAD